MKAHLSAPCVTRERGNKNTKGFSDGRTEGRKKERRDDQRKRSTCTLHNEVYLQIVVSFAMRYCIAVEGMEKRVERGKTPDRQVRYDDYCFA